MTGPDDDNGALLIRPAERRDAAALRDIYNHFVNTSTALFDLVPRTIDQQAQWIDEHSGGHLAVVAVDDGRVVWIRLTLDVSGTAGVRDDG